MTAGLLAYRLCDRAYDCAGCPLDAALHGNAGAATAELPPRGRALTFPADRSYTAGHLWVQRRAGGARIGLDALAACLAGPPAAVRVLADRVVAGDVMAALDLAQGRVPLTAPAPGTVALNPGVRLRPGLAGDDPYGEGWLLQLGGDSALPRLLDASAAERQAIHDARRFARRAALHLLDGTADAGPTLADGGAPITDLRAVLGPRRCLELLRELIH
jgi:glycine cleavage system H lipoate-binding protein